MFGTGADPAARGAQGSGKMSKSKFRAANSRARGRDEDAKSGSSEESWTVQPGTEVYTSDGEKLGGVNAIEDGHLVISKGGWFSRDIRVPVSAVAAHTDTRIDLDVTSAEVSDQAWEPAEDEVADESAIVAGSTDDAPATDASVVSPVEDFDVVRVPVIEEQLEAVKRTVERGSVRITSSVSEHEATLSVPVTEERVRIQRVPVDRVASAADMTGFNQVVEVPVYGEDIDLTTQARVVEGGRDRQGRHRGDAGDERNGRSS